MVVRRPANGAVGYQEEKLVFSYLFHCHPPGLHNWILLSQMLCTGMLFWGNVCFHVLSTREM